MRYYARFWQIESHIILDADSISCPAGQNFLGKCIPRTHQPGRQIFLLHTYYSGADSIYCEVGQNFQGKRVQGNPFSWWTDFSVTTDSS